MRPAASLMSSRIRWLAIPPSSHWIMAGSASGGAERATRSMSSRRKPALTRVSAGIHGSATPLSSSQSESWSSSSDRRTGERAPERGLSATSRRSASTASSAAGPAPHPATATTSPGMRASRSRSSAAFRDTEAAGLFSSWASPADSRPRAIILSRCCSIRVASRTRSERSATSRCPSSGERDSSSGKRSRERRSRRPAVIPTTTPL
jgi:hypothetical protein